MDVRKYEIISGVEQDISLVRFAHSQVSWSTLEINFLFCTHPCIILYLIYLVHLD